MCHASAASAVQTRKLAAREAVRTTAGGEATGSKRRAVRPGSTHPRSYCSPYAHRASGGRACRTRAKTSRVTLSCDCPGRPHTRTATAAQALGRAAATAQAGRRFQNCVRSVSLSFENRPRMLLICERESVSSLSLYTSLFGVCFGVQSLSLFIITYPSKLQNKLQNGCVI